MFNPLKFVKGGASIFMKVVIVGVLYNGCKSIGRWTLKKCYYCKYENDDNYKYERIDRKKKKKKKRKKIKKQKNIEEILI